MILNVNKEVDDFSAKIANLRCNYFKDPISL